MQTEIQGSRDSPAAMYCSVSAHARVTVPLCWSKDILEQEKHMQKVSTGGHNFLIVTKGAKAWQKNEHSTYTNNVMMNQTR